MTMKCACLLAALALLCCGGVASALECYADVKMTKTCTPKAGWCVTFDGTGKALSVVGADVQVRYCDDGKYGCKKAGCQKDVKLDDGTIIGVTDAKGELCCCKDKDKCNSAAFSSDAPRVRIAPAALLAAAFGALAVANGWLA